MLGPALWPTHSNLVLREHHEAPAPTRGIFGPECAMHMPRQSAAPGLPQPHEERQKARGTVQAWPEPIRLRSGQALSRAHRIPAEDIRDEKEKE